MATPSVSNPQSGQAVPLQPLAGQAQPPPQAGAPYYPRPAYPTQVVLTQPGGVAQQTLTGNTTNLPKYAFLTSVATTLIFTVLCWVPGLLCLVPATIMSIVALSKKEKNKQQEAKLYSIISFVLVLIFIISYPILVTVVLLSTVFGYWCKPVYPSYRGYYGYYYSYSYSRC